MVLFDVDGVLTDGTFTIDDEGREAKRFHARDGLGIYMLRSAGYKMGIISGRSAPVVEVRAKQLGIEEVHQGASDKLVVLEDILSRHGLTASEVCYVGDDLIDLPVMTRAGFAVAPADAHPLVIEAANMVTKNPGGHGAVREVAEAVLRGGGHFDRVVKEFQR